MYEREKGDSDKMNYLYDLIIGILVGFLSRFLVEIFYNSNIEITLLVMGILFPYVILGQCYGSYTK